MKVIVTGANGFLGSWLTRKLVDLGYETYALVRKKSDLSELEGVECKYLYGDVTDLNSLKDAFKNIDIVFHLAGIIAYKASQRQMMEEVNVGGTSNVIEAMRICGVKKIVHVSSVVAIGAGFTDKEILNENSEFNVSQLNLGYFETKRKAELLIKEATSHGFINSVIINPSTVYGAGDARKGSRKIQVKVAQGKFKFYPAGGVNVVAVEDVVDGIIAALEKGKNGERYILCSDNLYIKDVFKIIADTAGVKPPSIHLPKLLLICLGKLGDLLEKFNIHSSFSSENAHTTTLYHWFDCSKAKKELGFNPRPSVEAIKNSVLWMRKNGLLN